MSPSLAVTERSNECELTHQRADQWQVRRLMVEFWQLARRLRFDPGSPPPPPVVGFEMETSFCSAKMFFIMTSFGR
jgi:hypothetical protein